MAAYCTSKLNAMGRDNSRTVLYLYYGTDPGAWVKIGLIKTHLKDTDISLVRHDSSI
jgi:hypothetical protein